MQHPSPSREIAVLIEIMQRLRDPDTGCPWDIKQDFASIVPYTIEEAYEIADAIKRDDMDDLCDELGDLLLQVVFHAQMANEQDSFEFSDVVQSITQKLIRRHPHVFGGPRAENGDVVKIQWDAIKEEEKKQRQLRRNANGLPREELSWLSSVPTNMPPMTEAMKMQQRASKVGFDWNDPNAVLSKLREEVDEIETEMNASDHADNRGNIESEIGDVLFAAVNLARHYDLDPEQAMRKTNNKFRKRFGFIEKELERQNRSLADASLDEMEILWQKAKSE